MSTECETSIEQEDQCQYKKGGYHRIKPLDLFASRYRVLKKVGWGQFSTVWLCRDEEKSSYVALKVSKSSIFYSDAAVSEMSILQHISEMQQILSFSSNSQNSNIVNLLDSFSHRGPNGRHFVLVFEILGVNLLEMVKSYEYRGIPLKILRPFLIQILQGLHFLHKECGVIHTDLKLENIVFELTERQKKELLETGSVKSQLLKKNENLKKESISAKNSKNQAKVKKNQRKTRKNPEFFNDQLKLKIIDFGNAVFSSGLCNKEIQTRSYRAPEVILGFQFNSKADIWSFGCIAFELITGELLFQPRAGEGYSEDDDHLASIWETFEDFPVDWAKTSKFAWKFFLKDKLKKLPDLQVFPLKDVLVSRYGFSERKAEEVSAFLNQVLKINPENRPSAEDLLLHPWLICDDND
jgi:serine/threonine-protein kinase SRPK3